MKSFIKITKLIKKIRPGRSLPKYKQYDSLMISFERILIFKIGSGFYVKKSTKNYTLNW